jgi:ABC-type amino acid transport substrate-binding protein
MSYIACDNNKSGSCDGITSNGVYLSITQFEESAQIDFSVGKYVNSSSVFYPSSSVNWNPTVNPVNINGTYKGQVYNTVNKMYYNDYNNSYNIFGFDDYDHQRTKLDLTNDFSLYRLSVPQTGDGIKKNSVVIYNQSGDIVSNILDDGNHNLILDGTHFINSYEFTTGNEDTVENQGTYGLGYYLLNT